MERYWEICILHAVFTHVIPLPKKSLRLNMPSILRCWYGMNWLRFSKFVTGKFPPSFLSTKKILLWNCFIDLMHISSEKWFNILLTFPCDNSFCLLFQFGGCRTFFSTGPDFWAMLFSSPVQVPVFLSLFWKVLMPPQNAKQILWILVAEKN